MERSLYLKDGNTRHFMTSKLWTQEGMNAPVRIVVSFQQRDRQGSQNSNNDFLRRPTTSAPGSFGAEKHSDVAISLKSDDD